MFLVQVRNSKESLAFNAEMHCSSIFNDFAYPNKFSIGFVSYADHGCF